MPSFRQHGQNSAGQAQRFLAAHDPINNLVHLRRDHVTAVQYRAARAQAFEIWADITGTTAAASQGAPIYSNCWVALPST